MHDINRSATAVSTHSATHHYNFAAASFLLLQDHRLLRQQGSRRRQVMRSCYCSLISHIQLQHKHARIMDSSSKRGFNIDHLQHQPQNQRCSRVNSSSAPAPLSDSSSHKAKEEDDDEAIHGGYKVISKSDLETCRWLTPAAATISSSSSNNDNDDNKAEQSEVIASSSASANISSGYSQLAAVSPNININGAAYGGAAVSSAYGCCFGPSYGAIAAATTGTSSTANMGSSSAAEMPFEIDFQMEGMDAGVAAAAAVAAVAAARRLEWQQGTENGIERAIFNFRFFSLLAVGGSLVGAFLCFLKGCVYIIDSYAAFYHMCSRGFHTGMVVLRLVEAVDVYLTGTVMLIFGMGLYGLFISNVSNNLPPHQDRALRNSSLFGMFVLQKRPKWMRIASLDELKSKLGHVVVMILLVKMFERSKAITIATSVDLLTYSICIFLISTALLVLRNLSHHAD